MNSTKLLNAVLIAVLCAGCGYALIRWIVPLLLPFLIAWGAAALLEPVVGRMQRRGIARGLAAGLCLLAALAAAGALLWLPLHRLSRELEELSSGFPEILARLSDFLSRWEGKLSGWLARLPEGFRDWAERAEHSAADRLADLPGTLSGKLLGLLSGMAAAAPRALLGAVTAVMGTYFISASYPELLHAAARLLPERFLCRMRLLRRDFRRTLGRWLRAQLILLGITFGMLCGAFLLLRVRYALLAALVTAAVDALPVLGAGTVLLPWAAYAFFSGEVPQGLGLVITYGAVTLLNQSIKAKLLGDQLGLHPLAALLSVYVGFRVWGVTGMIVFPILAVSLKQVLDSGVLPLKRVSRER